MFYTTMFFALILALLFASFLSYVFGRKGPGPGGGYLFFATIIFLFTWAFGAWIAPLGPVHFGISWLGYLLVAILIMLLLGALVPPPRSPDKLEHRPLGDEELFHRKTSAHPLGLGLGLFFWTMVIALVAITIIKYIYIG